MNRASSVEDEAEEEGEEEELEGDKGDDDEDDDEDVECDELRVDSDDVELILYCCWGLNAIGDVSGVGIFSDRYCCCI